MFDKVKGIAVKGGFFGEESKSLGTILSSRMNIVFGRNGSDRNLYNCPYPFIEAVADDAASSLLMHSVVTGSAAAITSLTLASITFLLT